MTRHPLAAADLPLLLAADYGGGLMKQKGGWARSFTAPRFSRPAVARLREQGLLEEWKSLGRVHITEAGRARLDAALAAIDVTAFETEMSL